MASKKATDDPLERLGAELRVRMFRSWLKSWFLDWKWADIKVLAALSMLVSVVYFIPVWLWVEFFDHFAAHRGVDPHLVFRLQLECGVLSGLMIVWWKTLIRAQAAHELRANVAGGSGRKYNHGDTIRGHIVSTIKRVPGGGEAWILALGKISAMLVVAIVLFKYIQGI